jgi:hypothetical protein
LCPVGESVVAPARTDSGRIRQSPSTSDWSSDLEDEKNETAFCELPLISQKKLRLPIRKYIVNRIELKIMRQYFSLLLVLAFLINAGCVEEYDSNTTVTTAQTLVTSTVPANTPGQTPAPAEMAYLANIKCALDTTTERSYHCNGNVRIRSGGSHEVQVITRYPDNNTFYSGTVDLGGNDAISKPFVIFPDLKYQGQNPNYFVKMDNTVYPVIWSGDYGVAWSNLPA